jgi:hypothetical protein
VGQYQIKLSLTGQWHRRQHGNGESHTACGLLIGIAYFSRDWILDENLCPVCFTKRERDTAEMLLIEREALEYVKARETAERFLEEDEDPTDEYDVPFPRDETGKDDS